MTPMPCSSTSVEGWGGVEPRLAGLTLVFFTRSTVAAELIPMILAAVTPLPQVLSFMTSIVVRELHVCS